MQRLLAALAIPVTLTLGCAAENIDSNPLRLDTDQDGEVTCADMDHMMDCMEAPDSDGCDMADLDHDGMVGDIDMDEMCNGLEAMGQCCGQSEGDEGDAEGGCHGDHGGMGDGDQGGGMGDGDHSGMGDGDHMGGMDGDHSGCSGGMGDEGGEGGDEGGMPPQDS